MLVITLVFGMTVIGCDLLLPNTPSDDNSFIGEWGGTVGKNGEEGTEAKITFTDTTWTLTVGTETTNGKYTKKTSVTATLEEGDYTIASCIIVLIDGLTVTFTNGKYKENVGDFTRIKEPPFSGTYSGTMTKSGTSTPESAAITFTDTTWTLTIGNESMTGTYTKTTAYTVTLNQTDYDNVGNCRYLNKELTVTITNGKFKDYTPGKFTKTP